MPQVKGTATWLTNVKQEQPQAREHIGIDESDVKIENNRMEKNLIENVDSLHMQKYRRRADQEFELRAAREDAERWRRMRDLTGKNHVLAAMEGRKHDRVDSITAIDFVSHANTTTIIEDKPRRQRAKTAFAKNTGFSTTYIDSDSDDDFPTYSALTSKSSSSTGSDNITGKKQSSRNLYSNGHGTQVSTNFNTFPSSKVSGKSKEIHINVQRAPTKKKRRPKTTLGISKVSSRFSDIMLEDTGVQDHNGKTPGRSFQELKDLTHIDKLSETMKRKRRSEAIKFKELQRKHDADVLQEKIHMFYKDVEEFKKKSKKESELWIRPYVFSAW